MAAFNAAAVAPQPFTAIYTLHTKGIQFAMMERRFTTKPGNGYLLESTSQATGFVALILKGQIEESSTGVFTDQGPRPMIYTYDRPGSKPKSIETHFDWKKHELTGTLKDKTGKRNWKTELNSPVIDMLLYQLAIMHDLAEGKKSLKYLVADKERIKTYIFSVVGEEDLDTPVGTLRTVKLNRIHEKKNKSTTLWCAIKLHYLPVRLEKVKNGRLDFVVIDSVNGL